MCMFLLFLPNKTIYTRPWHILEWHICLLLTIFDGLARCRETAVLANFTLKYFCCSKNNFYWKSFICLEVEKTLIYSLKTFSNLHSHFNTSRSLVKSIVQKLLTNTVATHDQCCQPLLYVKRQFCVRSQLSLRIWRQLSVRRQFSVWRQLYVRRQLSVRGQLSVRRQLSVRGQWSVRTLLSLKMNCLNMMRNIKVGNTVCRLANE